MKQCTIAAGFGNAAYQKDPAHSFAHFGMDCDSLGVINFDVIASAKGTVLGVEFNSHNSLGGIVVVKYPNVFIPKTGQVKDLIFRYIHMASIRVSKGAAVSPYSVLGTVSGNHKWWNHIHVEIDSDISHPFHTPQVVEVSSALLVRANANASTMLDPANVFVVGKQQSAMIHPLAVYTDAKDAPRYLEGDFSVGSEGCSGDFQSCQRLILPINNMKVTAGYKNKKYESLVVNGLWMGTHYGLDCSGSSVVYGSGDGTVLLAGLDRILGNVVVVKYEDALNHKTNKSSSIVVRHHHLASVSVKTGDKVTKDTKLGVMGATGKYCKGTHLHIECDTDVKNFRHTPTLSGNSNLMFAGLRGTGDTTINPAEVMHCKVSAPDKQTVSRTMDGYTSASDIDVPKIQ